MSVGQVIVEVPLSDYAGGVYAEKLDATVHFKNEAGSMEDFIAFVDGQREDGLVVELRTDANSQYPIADVRAEQYRLTAFGPHFSTDEENAQDHGEDATRLAIAARIELDKGGE